MNREELSKLNREELSKLNRNDLIKLTKNVGLKGLGNYVSEALIDILKKPKIWTSKSAMDWVNQYYKDPLSHLRVKGQYLPNDIVDLIKEKNLLEDEVKEKLNNISYIRNGIPYIDDLFNYDHVVLITKLKIHEIRDVDAKIDDFINRIIGPLIVDYYSIDRALEEIRFILEPNDALVDDDIPYFDYRKEILINLIKKFNNKFNINFKKYKVTIIKQKIDNINNEINALNEFLPNNKEIKIKLINSPFMEISSNKLNRSLSISRSTQNSTRRKARSLGKSTPRVRSRAKRHVFRRLENK